jgi:hypothetical protein
MARLSRSHHRRLLWPLAASLVVGLTGYDAGTSSLGAASRRTTPVAATEAVRRAVVAAEAGALVPKVTTPGLRAARVDDVDLGTCSAFKKDRSKVCDFGDPRGTKTVAVFGDSHSVMWVPGLAIVAKAERWRLIPLVKQACGYAGYVRHGDNPCALFYRWAKKVIAELHPDVIVIGSYTSPSSWEFGEEEVVAQLKPLTHRLILLSDTPWIATPATCLTQSLATQETCLWNEPHSRMEAAYDVSKIAATMRVGYVNVTPWFCDKGLCPSVVDDYIPYYDGSHLTPQYSEFLAIDLEWALNLDGTATKQPVEVRLPHGRPLSATRS